MTQVSCCKCGTEYPLQLREAVGSRFPVIQCPNCGLVHTVDFQTEKILPGIELKTIRLLSYYYSELSADGSGVQGAIGSDENPPVKQSEDETSWATSSKFWIGIGVSEAGCNKTVDTNATFSLRYREDGGSWQDLGTGNLAVAGTGNMNYTDLSPPNADCWVAQAASCGGSIEPGDHVAQDNSRDLSSGVGTGNYVKELWWACDPASVPAGTLLEFGVYDSQGNIGTSGSPALLDCSITIAAAPITLVMTDGGATHAITTNGDNSAIDLTEVFDLTVADCSHPVYTNGSPGQDITITEVIPPVDLVISDSGLSQHVLLDNGGAALDLGQHFLTTADSAHAITTNGDNSPIDLVHDHYLVISDSGLCQHVLLDNGGAALDITHDHYLVISDAGLCQHVLLDNGGVALDIVHDHYLVITEAGLNQHVHPIGEPYCFSVLNSSHLMDSIPENITLTQTGAIDLVITDGGATHAITTNGDNSPLDLDLVITVANSTHAITTNGDNSALDLDIVLETTQDASHAIYTQDPLWWPNSCTHLHSAGAIIIDPAWANAQDSSHLMDSIPENITITETGDVTLIMTDGGASHVVTSPELPATQVYPDSTTHSHIVTPTNLTLVEVYTLTIAPDPYHLVQTKDEVWFIQKSIHQVSSQPSDVTLTLTISVDACVHVVEDSAPLSLVQIYDLVISDAGLSYHAVQSIPTDLNLAGIVTLTMTDGGAQHAHTAPNLDLTTTLAPADCTHLHSAGTPALTQEHTLAISDDTLVHLADSITMTVDTGLDVLDAERTLKPIGIAYSVADVGAERTLHKI